MCLCGEISELADTPDGFLAILALAEGGEAQVAFAAGAESYAGRADDVGTVKQLVEELPRGHSFGSLHPQIRRVYASEHPVAGTGQAFAHRTGVFHIVGDGFLHLCPAFGRIDRLGTTLGDVAGAVELGALAPVPQGIERDALVIEGSGGHFLGHHGIAATHARKAGGFREAAYLDGYFFRPAYLVDGMGNIVIVDVSLVGGIEDDERIVSQRIVDPLLQLVARERGACRVIGIAQVDQVDAVVGDGWDKAVCGGAGQVSNVAPASVFAQRTGTPAHHVAVDIGRIDRIGDAHTVIPTQEFADIARVALRPVADEYFGGAELDAARREVVLDDGFYQEIVSLLGTVAVEGRG